MEYHEFLAYLFDYPQTRELAHTLATAAHSRATATTKASAEERVLVDA